MCCEVSCREERARCSGFQYHQRAKRIFRWCVLWPVRCLASRLDLSASALECDQDALRALHPAQASCALSWGHVLSVLLCLSCTGWDTVVLRLHLGVPLFSPCPLRNSARMITIAHLCHHVQLRHLSKEENTSGVGLSIALMDTAGSPGFVPDGADALDVTRMIASQSSSAIHYKVHTAHPLYTIQVHCSFFIR